MLTNNRFYQMGKLICPLRWFIIGLWVGLLLACLPLLPNIITPFKTTGFVDERSQSYQAQSYINQNLGYSHDNQFLILYTSTELRTTEALFFKKIKKSLAGLRNFPIKHEIIYPDHHEQQISKDKHSAYVVVMLKDEEPLTDKQLARFKALIKPVTQMHLQIGGEPIFVEDVNHQTERDLYKADSIATPIAVLTLVIVFGSVLAGLLPILLGGGAALIILTSLYFLGHILTLSIFTLNIALLLGLCLSLDYSLFIISRFKDELHKGLSVPDAIAQTQVTAGRAIFFSGLAVFASLSALLLFPINILFSVAVGGLVAVFIAVLSATVFLPAILSVLGHNINVLPVRFLNRHGKRPGVFWHRIAEKVVGRPVFCFLTILIFLLMLGYPFLSVKLGVSDYRIFPEHSKNRQFFDAYAEKFNERELTPIYMLVKVPKGSILSQQNISKLYDLTHQLQDNPAIKEVNSIVTVDSQLTKTAYKGLYHQPKRSMSSEIKKLLETTTRRHFTVITIISKYPANATKTSTLIHDLENIKAVKGMSIELTGTPVSNRDVLEVITNKLPYALLWIMMFSYLILLLLLRSVFLPVKAILMNLLSLCACYGALVLVFQEGYLHQFLNFQPQGMLDISLLVIIFCALFGFSMDYEVFLLSRIKESYDLTHDNKKSIVFGIEKSSRIITSAALIVIFLCGSFLVADVLMVKAFGLGIAVAIFVDAFLIRTILVPATMALVKTWNWYLPQWLNKLLPK